MSTCVCICWNVCLNQFYRLGYLVKEYIGNDEIASCIHLSNLNTRKPKKDDLECSK